LIYQIVVTMKRQSLVRMHAVAGILAFCLIASFFVCSLVSEIAGTLSWIVSVKKGIFYSMWAMLILLPTTVLTGTKLAGKSKDPIIAGKRKRLRWIAPNGVLLLTLASYLWYKANLGEFDSLFVAAQVLEFVVGLTNILLLGLMIRDGFRLKSNYQKPSRSTPKPAL